MLQIPRTMSYPIFLNQLSVKALLCFKTQVEFETLRSQWIPAPSLILSGLYFLWTSACLIVSLTNAVCYPYLPLYTFSCSTPDYKFHPKRKHVLCLPTQHIDPAMCAAKESLQ